MKKFIRKTELSVNQTNSGHLQNYNGSTDDSGDKVAFVHEISIKHAWHFKRRFSLSTHTRDVYHSKNYRKHIKISCAQ